MLYQRWGFCVTFHGLWCYLGSVGFLASYVLLHVVLDIPSYITFAISTQEGALSIIMSHRSPSDTLEYSWTQLKQLKFSPATVGSIPAPVL